jgi:hypothetical protein
MNPSCGCYFTPSKYRPDQEYCGKSDCKRYRDRLRQKNYYRRNISDPSWRGALMERKKKERNSRINSVADNVSGNSPPTLSDLHLLLPGMIAFFSGASSHDEVMKITDKCRRFGNDLIGPEKNFQSFPHAGFEAEKESSSR